MKALVIPTEGEPYVSEAEWEYAQIKGTIGGWLEGVPVPGHEAHMYVNEDGRRERLEPNDLASILARTDIVGPAIVFGNAELPDESDVPESVLDRVL